MPGPQRLRRRRLLWLLACLCASWPAAAQSEPAAPPPGLPPVLAPWVPWVLHGHEDAVCPRVDGHTECVWPALLSLDLHGSGGRFALDVYAERDLYVPLPGSEDRFPQVVTLDGDPAVVLDGPQVWVAAGAHRIEGTFLWSSLPKSLSTPKRTARLQLRLNRRPVERPKRDLSGNLWLQADANDPHDQPRLSVEVYRRITDGIPLQVTTHIALAAGGTAREVLLPNPLLPGTFAIELKTTLPARLEQDGRLRVQLSAGEHQIEIRALSPGRIPRLPAPEHDAPWPAHEVWVWAADPVLRQVELSGAARIDPARTNLPAGFRGLPTYVLTSGDTLRLQTRRRGDAEPRPNRLRIQRQLWLELDGQAYTVRDELEGEMHHGFRLDLQHGTLGRMAIGGQDQLITRHGSHTGVEIRSGTLGAVAEWRVPRTGSRLPAVAWSEDLTSLQTTLHLPPGWALLDVQGADRADDTLLSRWDLWSFFFVLLVALGTARLCGVRWGLLSLVALILCSHQPGAPELVWLWLLGSLALSRASLHGKARTLAHGLLGISLLAVVLIAVPFAIQQIRLALYPQVESGDVELPKPRAPAAEPAPASLPLRMEAADMAARDTMGGNVGLAGTELRRQARPQAKYDKGKAPSASWPGAFRQALDTDPDAVVQTGPGVPSWHHKRHTITWSGPVQRDQRLSLRLLPPPVNRLLSLLRVLLLGAWLFGLLRTVRPGQALGSTAAVALLGLVGFQGLPATARAQDSGAVPPPAILDELRTRLTEPPPCSPACVSVRHLQVRIAGEELALTATVDAGAVAAYQAPGPLSAWAPEEVADNGADATASARLRGDFLHVRLTPGAHVVALSGPVPDTDTLTLQLGTPPHRVKVVAQGWEVDGVRPDGTAADAIQLRRAISRPERVESAVTLRPWLEITRRFHFGVNFRVHTHVRRRGSSDTALLVRFPLLPGESVTQESVEADRGAALLRLGPDVQETDFASALELRSELALQAPEPDEAHPWSETWEIDCGVLYRCAVQGLAPVTRLHDDHVLSTYRPYPGETLDLRLTRLAGASGASSTVDHATLTWTPGDRLSLAELELAVRSSGGTTLHLTLPKGVQLQTVAVDGAPRVARLQGRDLELSIDPGAHQLTATWQQPLGIGPRFHAPRVALDRRPANVRVRLNVPEGRWLLWTSGPRWGPAVLFWAYLLTALLFALALSRVPGSPLRAHQWALLSLGLTQVEPGAALLVVGWFFAMWARSRWTPSSRLAFNGLQVMLVVLTVLAITILIEAVHAGLVVQPDMQVEGAGSNNHTLVWYVDRAAKALPAPSLYSLPLWVYKGLMLLWALWLSASALSWLRFSFRAFSTGGRWQHRPKDQAARAKTRFGRGARLAAERGQNEPRAKA